MRHLFLPLSITLTVSLVGNAMHAQSRLKLDCNEIAVNAVKPATDDTLRKIYGKVIGVGEFTGPDGMVTAHSAAVKDMVLLNLQDCKEFRVTDRTQLDKVLEELRLQMSGPMDDSTVVRAGLLAGAQVMAVGHLQTDTYTQDIRRTESVDQKTGQKVVNEEVNRRYQVTITLQFIDVETGMTIHQMNMAYRSDDELIPPIGAPKGYERVPGGINATEPSMWQVCLDRASTRVRHAIAPYTEQEKLRFQSSKATKDSVAMVVLKYQTHHEDEALRMLERLAADTKLDTREQARMACNLGLYFRAQGDYLKAKEHFEKAYMLAPKEDDYRNWFEEMYRLTKS